MKWILGLFLVLVPCAGLLACDEEGDNYLKGSVKKNYNISFNGVRARLFSSELAVSTFTTKARWSCA